MTRPRITWIASYPKSGNTWVRFLVAGLLDGPLEDTTRARRIVPDLHEGLDPAALAGRERAYVKTHLKFGPEMPLERFTGGFVHVLRNPLDVLASNLSFLLLTSAGRLGDLDAPGRRKIVDNYVDGYLANRGDPRWIAAGMGSWTEHQQSWRDAASRVLGLTLRYEDMLENTVGAAGEICRFLGIERTAAEIAEIVERSSFASMRALEERELREARPGFFYRPEFSAGHREGRRFMNRGRAGSAGVELSPAQLARAESVFREPMRELGYAGSSVRARSPAPGPPPGAG